MLAKTMLAGSRLLLVVFFMVWLNVEVEGLCSDKTNTTCEECVRDFDCYWCASTKFCGKRPTIKPSNEECSGKWFSYSQCKVNGNLLLIIVPICLVVLLVVIGCCIYCCCCRQCLRERQRKKWAKEDSRRDQKKQEREAKYKQRDEERRIRHDQIRQKYGLFKDENSYERFDNS